MISPVTKTFDSSLKQTILLFIIVPRPLIILNSIISKKASFDEDVGRRKITHSRRAIFIYTNDVAEVFKSPSECNHSSTEVDTRQSNFFENRWAGVSSYAQYEFNDVAFPAVT